MPARRSHTLEVTIGEIAPGGEGVAVVPIDGEPRAIFVPGLMTGERASVEVDLGSRPARGRTLALLEPSAARVAPACAESGPEGRCGGCDWMHMSPEAQRREHARIVRRVLPEAFAGLEIVSHAAPAPLGYRTRARVHLESSAARRGQRDARDRVVVGMYAKRSRAPAEVDSCVVLHPALDEARALLATLLEGARGRGDAHLSLGALDTPRKAVLEIHWFGELPAVVFSRLERAVGEAAIAGARVFAGDVKVPATIGDPTPWIRGADGAPLRLSPGGFAQASEEGNVLLASRVAALAHDLAPDASGAATTELYAGAGNLTVLLARDREVVAIEKERAACVAARANLDARGLRARVVEANAETHAIAAGSRLVVLDPPRTGARAVATALATRPPSASVAVLYVSCDPPTLGRDLAILVAGGYEPLALETVELFPQTSHVETIAVLRRKKGRR